MKTFTHFGNKVTMQYGGDSFISYLCKNGIEYRVLPIIDDHIVIAAYKKDNITKYAVEIETSPTSDDADAGYRIFITDTVPEDGWESMLRDVVRQESGCEPSKPKSYVKEVLERIDARIQEERAAKTDDSFLAMFEETAEWTVEEYGKAHRLMRLYRIFDMSDAETLGAWDVDKKILDAIFAAPMVW